MNKIYGIILLLLIPCMTYAQAAPTKLWGEVKNTSGEAMDFASIVVMNPNLPNKILASTYTGDDGKYQITVRCDCDDNADLTKVVDDAVEVYKELYVADAKTIDTNRLKQTINLNLSKQPAVSENVLIIERDGKSL